MSPASAPAKKHVTAPKGPSTPETEPRPAPRLVPFSRPGNRKHPVTGQAWLEAHHFAEMLPRMSEGEYEALLASIRTDGLQEEIVLYEGAILDGRHRFRACWEASVPYKTRAFSGDDALTYVLSANLYRRHLNPSQQALIAAEAARARATVRGKGRKKDGEIGITEAIQDMVTATGTPERSIRRALEVLDQGIEPLNAAVRDGTVRVSTACDALALVDRNKIVPALRDGTLNAAIRAAKQSNGHTPAPSVEKIDELSRKLGAATLTKTCDCDLLVLIPPYAGNWDRKVDDCIAHLIAVAGLWAETGPDHIAVGWRNAPDLFAVAAAMAKIAGYSLIHVAGWVASIPDAPLHLSGLVRSLVPVLIYQRTGYRDPRKRFALDGATMYGLDTLVRPVAAAPATKGYSKDLTLHAALPDEVFRWLGTALADSGAMVACPFTPNDALALLRAHGRKAVGITRTKSEIAEALAAPIA